MKKKRWAWVLTGSGHFFNECISLINELEDVDVFVSKAAEEVLIMYKKKNDLSPKVKIYKIGGAQAIFAMSNGTKSIPQVEKIFGPGNEYVNEAKKQIEKNIKTVPSFPILETLIVLVFVRTYSEPIITNISLIKIP